MNCELARYAAPSRGVGGYTYGIVQGPPWREASSEKLDSIVPSDVLRCVASCTVIYRVPSSTRVENFYGSGHKPGLKTKRYNGRMYAVDVQILVMKRSKSWTKKMEGSCSFKNKKKRINVWVVGVGVGFVTRESYVTTWKRSKTG